MPPFGPVFLHGCSVCNACSIYLYGDPETVVFRGDRKAVIFKDDREAVNCPLELVRDPVWGGRIRFPLLR